MLLSILIQVLSNYVLLALQCAVFMILNTLDGYSTWLVMKPDHYERERNPIARLVFKKLKPPASIVFFKTVILACLGVFIAFWWQQSLSINIALLIGNVLFILVVKHNFRVLKKYKQRERSAALLRQLQEAIR